MATFFGEVILPSSRAFFDDGDDSDYESGDNESTRESIQVNTIDSSSSKSNYDVLVVSDGTIAKDFVENRMESEKKLICEFTVKSENELHDETEMIYSKKLTVKPSLVASLYRSQNNLYLLTNNTLQLKHANVLTSHMIPWIKKCKEVVLFASRSLSEYKHDTTDNMAQTLVKYITTSHTNIDMSRSNRLQQPNFISGLAASVMSWCEVNKTSCVMLVCYSDCLFSDSVTLQPLYDTLKNSKYRSLVSTQSESSSASSAKYNNPTHLNVMYQ